MLMNYKSIPDNDPIPIPITDDFYRSSKKSELDMNDKSKIGGMVFGNFKKKNDKSPKLSLAVIKWNQMPLILADWDETLYLKLQSYPQQE